MEVYPSQSLDFTCLKNRRVLPQRVRNVSFIVYTPANIYKHFYALYYKDWHFAYAFFDTFNCYYDHKKGIIGKCEPFTLD
jgi:hypothetical protein